jgi:hypothetical protein
MLLRQTRRGNGRIKTRISQSTERIRPARYRDRAPMCRPKPGGYRRVRRSMWRLVPQPGQNASSHGVPASSAPRMVGDHSIGPRFGNGRRPRGQPRLGVRASVSLASGAISAEDAQHLTLRHRSAAQSERPVRRHQTGVKTAPFQVTLPQARLQFPEPAGIDRAPRARLLALPKDHRF